MVSLNLQEISHFLVVLVRREGLVPRARDGAVARDHGAHAAPGCLETQRQRGHIQQDDVFGALWIGGGLWSLIFWYWLATDTST